MGCLHDFDGGVDEGEVAGGAGHGGVEPAEEVDGRVGFGGVCSPCRRIRRATGRPGLCGR